MGVGGDVPEGLRGDAADESPLVFTCNKYDSGDAENNDAKLRNQIPGEFDCHVLSQRLSYWKNTENQ